MKQLSDETPSNKAELLQLGTAVDPALLRLPAVKLAPALLGRLLLRRHGDEWLGGLICETEAYTEDDPASHCFVGMTPRNRSMFAEPGTLYVYRSYGIHWCLNIKSGSAGRGEGVLIRALEPRLGLATMAMLRQLPAAKPRCQLSNGPGKLAQALAIDRSLDGTMINSEVVFLMDLDAPLIPALKRVKGPRIGISQGLDRMWRFGIAGHACLSRPFQAGPAPTLLM